MSKVRPHVAVVALVIDDKGRFLMGKRDSNLGEYYSPPGGVVNEDETYAHAAIRRVREETGLQIDESHVDYSDLVFTYELDVHFFKITDCKGDIKILEPKCQSWHFFSREELNDLQLTHSMKKWLETNC